ncbi:MAG TPA: hypothetical protein ENH85_02430 [Candidatus Scalindua sp.]|nr:hypothetical protein [Candidatus Scalindua sp.]
MRNTSSYLSSNIQEKELKDKPDNFNTWVGKLQNKRLCLKCGKKFLSEGPHNRICVKCGLINVRIIVGTYSVSLRFSDVMI